MSDVNFEKMVDRISKIAELDRDEVLRRIEAKCAKLSGLISKEGAAQVVAAELGISFENEKFKIEELLPGMKRVNFIGKVINIFPVRTFERNGQTSKVANMIIADDTANIKVVLWDIHHIELIENNTISKDCVVEILNSSVREGEVHLGSFSEFKLSKEILEKVKTERVFKEKHIKDFRVGEIASVRAFVVQNFEPRFFYVCSECKKKANPGEGGIYNCDEHGKIIPEKRVLINLVIDDGTETIRAVLFHENLLKIGLTEFENTAILEQQKQNLLGKELVFQGSVKMNNFFNNPEFIVNEIKEVELDNLLKNLEN